MPKPAPGGQRFFCGGTVVPFPSRERAEAGQDQTFDLNSVLIIVIERCRRRMARGLTIGLCAKSGKDVLVVPQEAAALDFVIREIVSNAWRHSHPGGSPVEVTIACAVTQDGEIMIDIGDDGVGLPVEFAEWRDAGDGLLSVRHRLQQIGAQLNVTSDDLGLRFQIILHARRKRPTPARGNFVWL